MKTPDGRECKYYYGDFHRGRNEQSCRLIEKAIEQARETEPWRPKLCSICPVPEILRANGSESLVLDARVVKKFFGLKLDIEVEGWCSECFSAVPDPMQGCPKCNAPHNRPSIFDLEESPK